MQKVIFCPVTNNNNFAINIICFHDKEDSIILSNMEYYPQPHDALALSMFMGKKKFVTHILEDK